jgi:hypothetical protein
MTALSAEVALPCKRRGFHSTITMSALALYCLRVCLLLSAPLAGILVVYVTAPSAEVADSRASVVAAIQALYCLHACSSLFPLQASWSCT